VRDCYCYYYFGSYTQLGPAPVGPYAILGPAHVKIQSNFESYINKTQSYLGHTPNRTQYPIRSCTRQDLGPNWALGHGEVGGTTQSCWVLVMRPNVVRSW
jgi:hypothetical protein